MIQCSFLPPTTGTIVNKVHEMFLFSGRSMRFRIQVPRNEQPQSCLRRKDTSGLFVCLLRNLSTYIACTLLNASIFHIDLRILTAKSCCCIWHNRG